MLEHAGFQEVSLGPKLECSLIDSFFFGAEQDLWNNTMAVQDEIRGDERGFGVNP